MTSLNLAIDRADVLELESKKLAARHDAFSRSAIWEAGASVFVFL